MKLDWAPPYPSKKILLAETEAMCNAAVHVFRSTIPESEIEGIYCKGSAVKEWDSPVDYVPELSDIDIHVLFSNETSAQNFLGTVRQTLTIGRTIELEYRKNISDPVHLPRPQIIILNELKKDPAYTPAPGSTVKTLFGREHEHPDYTGSKDLIRKIDAKGITRDREFLKELPLQVIDKPGKYLWSAIRGLTWRVSPAGPRSLHLKGLDTAYAWGLNRTGIIEEFLKLDEHLIASAYFHFYKYGWDSFLSGFTDSKAMGLCIENGVKVLEHGIQIAEQYSAERGVRKNE